MTLKPTGCHPPVTGISSATLASLSPRKVFILPMIKAVPFSMVCQGFGVRGAGHNRQEISAAVNAQMQTLSYAPAFQFGHPGAFELANKVKALTPEKLDYTFFNNIFPMP